MGIGSLSKFASMLLAPFGKSVFIFITHIAAMCWDASYEYIVDLFQFFKRLYCVKGSFGL